MKTNVYVLAGGKSTEHEISLISATAIANSMDREKYEVFGIYITPDGVWVDCGKLEKTIESPEEWKRSSSATPGESIGEFFKRFNYHEKSIVLPALHGTNGEDGKIQGLFEAADIPYTGNGVLSSAVGMDKSVMKDLFARAGIDQAKYLYFTRYDYENHPSEVLERVEREIPYPVFVKPSNNGSSVGISRAEDRKGLEQSIALALKYDRIVLVEEEIRGREIQISVLGNDEPKASVPGEFIMERPFFDYEAKYIEKKIIPVVPARMTDETMAKMRETAVFAYKTLRCNGLARVDFFILEDESFKVCEINTMPGFTAMSFTPVLWGHTDGTTYAGVVEKLIALGFESYEKKNDISVKRS